MSFTSPALASLTCLALLAVPAPTTAQSFGTMSQTVDAKEGCKAPRPPKDLAETAYIRNGYRAILRIMAAEKWRETGVCDCFINAFTWEDVLETGTAYITSSDLNRPFDTSELRIKADTLDEMREEACVD